MTTFSPYTVGRVATRRSTGLPPTFSEMRPSWGMRRSAMLMSAMTLRRLITPAWMVRGERMTSWSTPSMRNRMRRSCSVGSTWMSDARSATAWVMSRLTNLTIGASSTTSLTTAEVVVVGELVGGDLGDRRRPRRRGGGSGRWPRRAALRVATTIVTSAPVIARMSSTAKTFDGSAIATTSRSSSQPIGSAW